MTDLDTLSALLAAAMAEHSEDVGFGHSTDSCGSGCARFVLARVPSLIEAARREAGLREALTGVVEALQEWRDSEITFPGRRLSKALDKARSLLHDNTGTAER